MPKMPQIFAYTIESRAADLQAAVAFAMTHFRNRFHRAPAAVWVHPELVTGDWPADWPPVFTNDKLNRNIIGLEVGAAALDQPAQLRLL